MLPASSAVSALDARHAGEYPTSERERGAERGVLSLPAVARLFDAAWRCAADGEWEEDAEERLCVFGVRGLAAFTDTRPRKVTGTGAPVGFSRWPWTISSEPDDSADSDKSDAYSRLEASLRGGLPVDQPFLLRAALVVSSALPTSFSTSESSTSACEFAGRCIPGALYAARAGG